MIIDAHVHLMEYEPTQHPWVTDDMPQLRRNFRPADLQPLLTAADVSGCVAVQARQKSEETDWLISIAASWPAMLAVVGWVDLTSPTLSEDLDRWRADGVLKGFRHVVIDEADPDFLERGEVLAGLAEIGRRGYSYDLLVLPEQLAGATRVCTRLPDQQFVLDHAGLPDIKGGGFTRWVGEIAALAACPNVSIKLSALEFRADWATWRGEDLQPYFEAAIESFGPSRVMIGSNWPVCTLSSSYEQTMNAVLEYVATLSSHEQADIRSGTARRSYRITETGIGETNV